MAKPSSSHGDLMAKPVKWIRDLMAKPSSGSAI
jgi:hypothetical protein